MAPLFITLKNLETKMFGYSKLKVALKLPLTLSLNKEYKRLFLLRPRSYKSHNKMKLQWWWHEVPRYNAYYIKMYLVFHVL